MGYGELVVQLLKGHSDGFEHARKQASTLCIYKMSWQFWELLNFFTFYACESIDLCQSRSKSMQLARCAVHRCDMHLSFTSNVTRCHRGPKRKLRAGYRAPSLKRTPCCDCFIVECGITQARFLCAIYACNWRSGVIMISFVSNFFSSAASIAELGHGEKSYKLTQSLTQLAYWITQSLTQLI